MPPNRNWARKGRIIFNSLRFFVSETNWRKFPPSVPLIRGVAIRKLSNWSFGYMRGHSAKFDRKKAKTPFSQLYILFSFRRNYSAFFSSSFFNLQKRNITASWHAIPRSNFGFFFWCFALALRLSSQEVLNYSWLDVSIKNTPFESAHKFPLGENWFSESLCLFFRRFGSENAHAIRHIHYAVFSRASRLTIGIYFLSLFSFSLSFCFTFLSTRRVLIFKGARENKSVRKRWLVISGFKSGKKRCCQFRFSCTLWACVSIEYSSDGSEVGVQGLDLCLIWNSNVLPLASPNI